MATADNYPVLVGVGESSQGSIGLKWPAPTDLAAAAVTDALEDSGRAEAFAASVDVLVGIRTFRDSILGGPFGGPENVPEVIAKKAGLSAERYIYGNIGGQSPQRFVNEMAELLASGEAKAVLIAGGEALGTTKRASRAGEKLNWDVTAESECEDRGQSDRVLAPREIMHGVVSMPIAYSLVENARRARLGQDRATYANEMAGLWSAFSEVSEGRQHAQYPGARSASDLLSEDAKNFRVTEPYMRWMVAQDSVDLGGAIAMTTLGHARELGISEDKIIYLTGYGDADDVPLTERKDMSRSIPLEKAVSAALAMAGIDSSALGPVDIYSCFPCAVSTGIEAIGGPQRASGFYTLTGGLSFFGGPGNGYSLHGIAAAVRALREDGSKPAMVTANGGLLTKQSVGIYSTGLANSTWTAGQGGKAIKPDSDGAPRIDEEPNGQAKVLTYTISSVKGRTYPPTLIVEMEDGARAICKMSGTMDDPEQDLLGVAVNVTSNDGKNSADLI